MAGPLHPRVLCWQTPCTSLATTTSLNGPHSFGTTPHPHLVCWGPPLLTALGLQVGAMQDQDIWRGGVGSANWFW